MASWCALPRAPFQAATAVLEILQFRGIYSFKNLVNCDMENLMLFVQGSPSGSAAEFSFLALPTSL